MPNFAENRIPVRFAPPSGAGPGDAVLLEGEGELPAGVPAARFAAGRPGHLVGCVCCAPRGAVAAALHRLFLARARGDDAFFTRVLVSAGPAGQAAVREAVLADSFLAGRYRLVE